MHNHAQDVTRTGQHSVCPDSILEAEALLFLLILATHVLSHEFIYLIVGWVSQHVVPFVVHEVFLTLFLSKRDRFTELPVRLAVQLIGLDEDRAARLSRLEEDKISRHTLPLYDFYDISNFDIL